jgi:hypothetical protein
MLKIQKCDNWVPHQNSRDLRLDRQAYQIKPSTNNLPTAYFPNPGATSQPIIPSNKQSSQNEISMPVNSRPFTNNRHEDQINERMQSLQPLPQGRAYPMVKNSLYQFQ